MMKRYGDILGVSYRSEGWTIRALAYAYRLRKNGQSQVVYVTNMRELREKISEFAGQL